MAKPYVPPISSRPLTKDYAERYPFARKCRGCHEPMRSEPVDALWCRRCKRMDAIRERTEA